MRISKYEAIHERYFIIAEMYKKTPQETHIHKILKSKSTSNMLKEEICFILKGPYSSKQKNVDKKNILW